MCAPQEALRTLEIALAQSFRCVTLRQQGKLRGKVGYAQRKSRTCGLGSFRLTGACAVFPDSIQAPQLGRLRLKEHGYLPGSGVRVLAATLSEHAGHWWASGLVGQEDAAAANSRPIVGVDLGIKTVAIISNGATEPYPRYLRQQLRKLKRLQHAVSRKQKGSRNRKKAVRRLDSLQRRVAHRRANRAHQLTDRLAKTKAVVVIDDLTVSGMLQNHHLAQAICDVGCDESRRQLAYKAVWSSCRVIVASRWAPTSKACSQGGWRDEQPTLAARTCHGQTGSLILDRDLNAAKNLAKLAAGSPGSQNAYGEESAGQTRVALVKLSPMKQASDAFDASA
jgi:putative transposase